MFHSDSVAERVHGSESNFRQKPEEEMSLFDPATLALDGEPRLRATVGRRARIAGTVKLAGASTGSFRVKLAGRLAQ